MRLQQSDLHTFEHHRQLTHVRNDYVGEHCTLRSRGLSLDWLGRVLPHPSCEAIELSQGLDVSGGATTGTRVRRTRPNTSCMSVHDKDSAPLVLRPTTPALR